MKIQIPEFALVVLIGASGSGKSTFAARHFAPTEVLSSDRFRGWVDDDENSLDANQDAFEALHFVAAKRLKRKRLTVIDATNVQASARKPLVALAREYHALPVAIVLDLPERVCRERNESRPDRQLGAHVVRNHGRDLRRSLKRLRREGFRQIYRLEGEERVEAAVVERQPLWSDFRREQGPFDLIGDIHGCFDEMVELLGELGYRPGEPVTDAGGEIVPWAHPDGRRAVFLGDLVDRGPRSVDVVRTVRAMVGAGSALAVPGNHDVKLVRKLRGEQVRVAHGLETTLAEIEALPDDVRDGLQTEMADFLGNLVSHAVLDGGRLVAAHAGMREEMQGRASGAVRAFALYGETSGETDEFGLPVRHDWAAQYRGRAVVVYGHTPVPEPEWVNDTVDIDTGCVFGGRLTALRWPERELVSVPAREVYSEPVRPLAATSAAAAAADGQSTTAQHAVDAEGISLTDVTGRRTIQTRLKKGVVVREEQAAAALETMSRFAADPRWLVYLPPTMSPSETSERDGYLEHPTEALGYYRRQGVQTVVCQEKHMGSRAVVVVARDAAAARSRFGVDGDQAGVVLSRTGRRFFREPDVERALLDRLRAAMDWADWWARLETDWAVLDCELMPWSAKARELLESQYAAVGAAADAALPAAVASLERAAAAGVEVGDLLAATRERRELVTRYREAYRRYCWSVESVGDLRLAPFHLLASEGKVHVDRDHRWHMEMAQSLTDQDDPLLHPTAWRCVELADEDSRAAAVAWWEELTGAGGEGMVVKPLDFVAYGRRGLVQPALKCRGREYLRIIYGPESTRGVHLERLRRRSLKTKRSLALRELALGIEALERFVRREPLRRVHECVFAVLALESEPVDPRL